MIAKEGICEAVGRTISLDLRSRFCARHESSAKICAKKRRYYVAVVVRPRHPILTGLGAWQQVLLTFPIQTALFVDFLETGFVFLLLKVTSIMIFQTNSRVSIY